MKTNIIELLDASLMQLDDQKSSNVDKYSRFYDPDDQIFIDLLLSAKGRSIFQVLETAINFIGKEVLHQGQDVTLSWSHIKTYLNALVPDSYDLHGVIDYAFRSVISNIKPHNVKGLLQITFDGNHDQIALAYIDFLRPILILKNTEYPKVVNAKVLLREEQYSFCRRFVMNDKGKLVLRDPKNLFKNDMLLKTLRADKFDFSYPFILGIVPGKNDTRRLQNLRPKNRQSYVVTPNGTIESRLSRKATHSPEEKAGYSQVQSCTLIDEHFLSPAFGFSTGRNAKLYGIMTDSRDALITRLLANDGGTVSRPFDHDSRESAEQSRAYQGYHAPVNERSYYSKNEINDFKTKNLELRSKQINTNEILARLRFNPDRSVVCINSDTLESRLLAYDFSQELLEEFKRYAEHMSIELNPTYDLPVIFYIERKDGSGLRVGHDIRLYTDEMRQNDQAEALEIYNNNDLRKKYYAHGDYEFLLGLPKITLSILLEPSPREPLALFMIRNGHVRMLMRLLRIGKYSQPNLCEELVEYIVENKLITRNDRAITELILAEQFDMADKFIAETKSSINNLPQGLRVSLPTLSDHLLENGTPRQIKYANLEKIWIDSPIKNWVPIILFIKEHPDLPSSFLDELLRIACLTKEHNAIKYLLKKGTPTNATKVSLHAHVLSDKKSFSPISNAAMNKDWETVALFCHYQIDYDDSSEFGYALYEALCDGQRNLVTLLLQKGVKATWRNNSHYSFQSRLRSTLYIALERGFDDLLIQLIDYENTFKDIYSDFRTMQALNLAHEKNNHDANRIIQEKLGSIVLIEPVDQEAILCQQVLEAYLSGGRLLARERLLHFCQQNQFLPTDEELTAFAHQWLSTLFRTPFNVNNRQSVIENCHIVMRHFRKDQLRKRCVEAFIDWVLINYVESHQRHEASTKYNLFSVIFSSNQQHTVSVSSQVVITGIIKTLSSSFRAELKKGDIENLSESRSMTPISMAAVQKDWELVRQIAQFPADPDDISEYGYALFEALQNGLLALVRILLDAGAKPTWRKNPDHSNKLLSTLYIAIYLNFYELLPELIEHEKKNQDEHFLHRIELALELATEKNNKIAINLIQEAWGPIALFDDANIIPRISQRILVTLRIEGENSAKVQLWSYLKLYHLMSDENALMAPVQEWRALLFRRSISEYLPMKDSFFEALKLIIPFFRPKEIKDRCISALTDWILSKPDLSELIVKLSRLNDPVLSKDIGSQVLDEIVNNLPTKEREILKKLNEYSTNRGITPIIRAAMENDWIFIRQITEIPTDVDDKFEYGYALCAAVGAGQEEISTLLLQAGAKPTWRANLGHLLECKLKSTCWAAIDRGLNQLLPQLIDYEKNTFDEYTLLGFEYALALAYEKDNQEAIALIQGKVHPIPIIDSNNVSESICRQVLIALTIEGQAVAERQLLNYCRQYHLLPSDLTTHAQLWVAAFFQRQFITKNACLVLEVLRIIMPHLCAILITFPAGEIRKTALKKMVRWILDYKDPTLFGLMTVISHLEDHTTREYFAQIVINTIIRNHPADIVLIREIIRLNFSSGFAQDIWRTIIDSRCDKIKTWKHKGQKSDDQVLLLFELNPMMPEDLLSRVFDCAIERLQHKIARSVVTRADLSKKTKDEIITYALEGHHANNTDRTIPLMMRNNFRVTINHLKYAKRCINKDYLLYLIEHLNIVEFPLVDYFWDYVSLYVPSIHKNIGLKFEKLWADLLGPSMVRHIVLIYWLKNYRDKTDYPNLSRFYLDNGIENKCLYTSELIKKYKELNYSDEKILKALNAYFFDNNILPKEDIILETYTTIMTHIEFAPQQRQTNSSGFFSLFSRDNNNNNIASTDQNLANSKESGLTLYQYMFELDQLLRKYEKASENEDVDTPLQFRTKSPFSTSLQ